MNSLEKRLSVALHTEITADPAQVKQTMLEVRAHYTAQPRRMSFSQFILLQARLCGVRMWLWQGIVMLMLLYGLNLVQVNSTIFFTLRLLPFLLGCCGVIAVTASVPFIYRAVRYQMRETEHACYFSGTQQLLARLLFIALGVLLTLAAAIGVVIGHHWLGIGCAVLYMCVPSLIAACGYLALLTHTEWERLPVLGGVFSASLMLIMRLMLHFGWYPKQFGIGSGILCIGLIFLCAVQVCRLAHTDSAVVG